MDVVNWVIYILRVIIGMVPGVNRIWQFPLIRIVPATPWFQAEAIDDSDPEQVTTANSRRKRLLFPAKVTNNGTTNALNCYPQLIEARERNDPHPIFWGVPLAWEGQALAGELQYKPELGNIVYREIPPGAESFTFFLASVEIQDPPSVRLFSVSHDDVNFATSVSFRPGEYELALSIVGDNFRCRPLRYGLSLGSAWDSVKLYRLPLSPWRRLRRKEPKRLSSKG